MSEIAFWAIPPEGTDERTRVNKYLESEKDNPEIPKKIKKIFDKATALIAVQQVNGLGFLADKMLREYNLEYNNRVLNGSLHDLPGSFNVAEAFNKFLPPSSTFKLRDEIDHIFSFDNFIDYITSASFDSSTTPTLENIIEGKFTLTIQQVTLKISYFQQTMVISMVFHLYPSLDSGMKSA